MVDKMNPFVSLRRQIREAAQQFRRNNDNSKSLFHPSGGFLYAYNINQVEHALDQYELTLPTSYQTVDNKRTIEARLIQEAETLCETSEDMDTRDFARTVAAYLAMHTNPYKRNPLRLLNVDYLEPDNDPTH
jgi:hypothetical protein